MSEPAAKRARTLDWDDPEKFNSFCCEVQEALKTRTSEINNGTPFRITVNGVTICYEVHAEGSHFSIPKECWVPYVHNGDHFAAIIPDGHETPIKLMRGKPVHHPAVSFDFDGDLQTLKTGWKVLGREVKDIVLVASDETKKIAKTFVAEAVKLACKDIGNRPPDIYELPAKSYNILTWDALQSKEYELPVTYTFEALLHYVVNDDGTISGVISFRCSTHDLKWTIDFINNLTKDQCESHLPTWAKEGTGNIPVDMRKTQLEGLLKSQTKWVEKSIAAYQATIFIVPATKMLRLGGQRYGEVQLPPTIEHCVDVERAGNVYKENPDGAPTFVRTLLFRVTDYGKPISELPGFEKDDHITSKTSFGININGTIVQATTQEIWAELFVKRNSNFYLID